MCTHPYTYIRTHAHILKSVRDYFCGRSASHNRWAGALNGRTRSEQTYIHTHTHTSVHIRTYQNVHGILFLRLLSAPWPVGRGVKPPNVWFYRKGSARRTWIGQSANSRLCSHLFFLTSTVLRFGAPTGHCEQCSHAKLWHTFTFDICAAEGC